MDSQVSLVLDGTDATRERRLDESFPRLFALQVERSPDRLAVSAGGASLTYGELSRRAGRLAHHLRRIGVGVDVPVGVLCGRTVEAIVAILGALRAGGCYVPLDPGQPRQRLARILDDLRPPVVVTVERFRELLAGSPAQQVCLDAGEPAPGAEPFGSEPDPEIPPDSLAYVLFTSGSTGQPKGVMIRHGSLANLFAALRETVYAGTEAPLRVSVNAPLVFDASVKQIIQLAAGHTLEIVPDEVRPDGAALRRFLSESRVEVLDCTPSQLRLLLEAGLDGSEGLRRILVGGEDVGEALWRRLAGVAEPACFNVYGPTECTVDVTAAAFPSSPDSPTIGRPLANMETYVVNHELQPLSAGTAGELLVGGEGLARGYWCASALTAERFIPDPLSGRPGARLYRTGDLARVRADGCLEFAGRADHQVKVRGYRIELGEIEAALESFPGVSAAAAIVREDRPGDPRLAGYAVLRGGAGDGSGEAERRRLREHLKERLPEYMVPADLVFLERLPYNRNGKVDRAALPPPPAGGEAELPGARSRSPFEGILAGIWAEVLGRDGIGAHEDFFDLGGHSLLAMQVLSRARVACGVDLPFASLLEHPTLASLAAELERAIARGGGLSLPPLEPAPRDRDLELSFPQEQIWWAERRWPGTDRYNCPHPVRVHGPLDAALLRRTLAEMVRRHESLRTRFLEVAGRPVQVIDPPGALPFLVVNLKGIPVARREAEALRLAAAEARIPFDLERGPLLRIILLRLDPEDAIVLFTLHHIVTDAWSVEVLVREVSTLYLALAMGQPIEKAPLPALSVQYADYAQWQRRWLTGDALAGELEYWRERLRGAPVLPLPFDRPPVGEPQGGASLWVDLPRALTAGFKTLCRRESATLSMGLLAVFQAVLWRWTGEPDVVVGTPVAGRPLLETEPLIGFFVNRLVLRSDLSDGPTLRELLRRARSQVLEAYAHQNLPFNRLVEELAPERGEERLPLFQVMFAVVDQPQQDVEAPGLTIRGLEIDGEAHAEYDLLFGMLHDGRDLFAEIKYSPECFELATIQRLAGLFEGLLEAALADPDRRLTELGALREAERGQLLTEPNGARVKARIARAGAATAGLRLPDFLIVGAMKSGSSSLVELLNRHGDISLPSRELYFFSERKKFAKGAGWYAEQLRRQAAPARLLGEKCVSYGYIEEAAPRIVDTLPGVKLVWILRNPAQRSYSNYMHNLRNGIERLPFRAALEREAAGRAPSVYTQYVARSRYAVEIRRYREHLSAARMHVLLFEDLLARPLEVLGELFRFLGVEAEGYEYRPVHRNSGRTPRFPRVVRLASALFGHGSTVHRRVRELCTTNGPYPRLREEDEAYLREALRESNAELAALLGRDLSVWEAPNR